MTTLTLSQIETLVRHVAVNKAKLDELRKIALLLHILQDKFSCDKELKAFIGQCAHESQGFISFSEKYNGNENEYFVKKYWRNQAVAVQLGNEQEEDAYRFRGRGLIQITGRWNYVNFSGKLTKEESAEILAKPSIVATDIELSTKLSIEYWIGAVQAKIPPVNDDTDNEKLFIETTRYINNGELGESLKAKKNTLEKEKSELILKKGQANTSSVEVNKINDKLKNIAKDLIKIEKKIGEYRDRLDKRRATVMAALTLEFSKDAKETPARTTLPFSFQFTPIRGTSAERALNAQRALFFEPVTGGACKIDDRTAHAERPKQRK